MRLSQLQQQLAELRDNLGDHQQTAEFHQRIVMLHSSISGIANACDNVPDCQCAPKLADIVIQIVSFPSQFPDWGDIWGSQEWEDFHVDKLFGDIWDHLYKLHQLTAGIVGGRSDIILLYKMIQVCRSLSQLLGIDLQEAVSERLDTVSSHPPQNLVL
ncbi:MAG: hypothetical protein FH749_13620 [Firmicutes bacterium]|nr:hypothetical protein [Bacillota bacterium]